jgi:hypothetical protein
MVIGWATCPGLLGWQQRTDKLPSLLIKLKVPIPTAQYVDCGEAGGTRSTFRVEPGIALGTWLGGTHAQATSGGMAAFRYRLVATTKGRPGEPYRETLSWFGQCDQ